MKILGIGDPHGKLPKNINTLAKQADVIVCIGEVFPITRSGSKKGSADLKTGEKIVDRLCGYGKPMFFFKGNMFFSEGGKKYYKKFLIKYTKKYPNFIVRRLGKAEVIRQTFIVLDMIYEEHNYTGRVSPYYTDPVKNKKRAQRLDTLFKDNPDAIFLTHAPPYSYVDKTITGLHVGSKIVLDAIKKHQPKLTLCGHIHEAKGEAKIGKSRVVNLGSEGDYQLIEI